jgi:hypothetical protein
VSEIVPQGYNNWWEYYRTSEAKVASVKEQLACGILIAVLFAAYCFIGNLEVLL